MRVKGEDLETALKLWHPEQLVTVYDTLLGIILYDDKIGNIAPDEVEPYTFAEPVDEDGQYCKPRLREDILSTFNQV